MPPDYKFIILMILENFFKNKKIFLTGHTGFKGSWLSLWMASAGASVCGYSLSPKNQSLFNILNLEKKIQKSIFADIRNAELLEKEIKIFAPDIIIHMAAQPLVRASYADPRYNYETNFIGTLNVFEAALKSSTVKAVVNITTDKCYENKEINYRYKEDDKLGGYDPYSASKACSEILTSSYRNSFFDKAGIALASARAGNVIGGGDFSVDRIIPDIFRAISENNAVQIRYPNAIRPWQHVLEPIYGYLILAQKLYENGNKFSQAYNFGPQEDNEINVQTLTEKFIASIGLGDYQISADANLHEAGILKLDNNRAQSELGWKPTLSCEDTISWTANWYKEFLSNQSKIADFTFSQINSFKNLINHE